MPEQKIYRHRVTIFFDTLEDLTDPQIAGVEKELKDFLSDPARAARIIVPGVTVANWETSWTIKEVKNADGGQES